MHTHVCEKRSNTCVHRHEPTYTTRVPKAMKGRFSTLKTEVWNESHITWEPFQTLNFQLYKPLHGIFQTHTENPTEKPKIR